MFVVWNKHDRLTQHRIQNRNKHFLIRRFRKKRFFFHVVSFAKIIIDIDVFEKIDDKTKQYENICRKFRDDDVCRKFLNDNVCWKLRRIVIINDFDDNDDDVVCWKFRQIVIINDFDDNDDDIFDDWKNEIDFVMFNTYVSMKIIVEKKWFTTYATTRLKTFDYCEVYWCFVLVIKILINWIVIFQIVIDDIIFVLNVVFVKDFLKRVSFFFRFINHINFCFIFTCVFFVVCDKFRLIFRIERVFDYFERLFCRRQNKSDRKILLTLKIEKLILKFLCFNINKILILMNIIIWWRSIIKNLKIVDEKLLLTILSFAIWFICLTIKFVDIVIIKFKIIEIVVKTLFNNLS